MRKIVQLFEADARYLPAAGLVDTSRETIEAAAAHIDEAPDDAFRGDLHTAVLNACNAAEQVRAMAWQYADTVTRRQARNEGTVQGAVAALRGMPNGPSPVDVNATTTALINGAREQISRAAFDQIKQEAANRAKAYVDALQGLSNAITRAKALAALPDAFDESETLETLARRATAEREINAKKRPAAYVRDTHAALVQAGELEKARYFASCARPLMVDLRDTPPGKLTARYDRDGSGAANAVSSERSIAYQWIASLEAADRQALAESSIGYAENAFATLRDLFVYLCGAHPQWLTRAQRVSQYMVDARGKDRWDVVVPDWPMRAPVGYSPVAQTLKSGALVRQPAK